ncbi:MAG: hypothetical protein LBN39_11655 [Planctomycetaceae bacterium]|nr:hypothetical protein [Planctomycetaceae bacterium]
MSVNFSLFPVQPNLTIAAHSWILAGGTHHMSFHTI